MAAYAKEAQYTSISELVRDMWRDWKRNQLLASLRASQKEFREGKARSNALFGLLIFSSSQYFFNHFISSVLA